MKATMAAITTQHAGAALAVVALIELGGCGSQPNSSTSLEGQVPSGSVDMQMFTAAYIGSASGGKGTLNFKGRTYPFSIGGAGIGGIGASSIQAAGEVYGLNSVAQFPGAYAQGRYGFAIGRASGGDLWLKNNTGVVMHLKAKREGLMLRLGGDAIVISMDQ